MDKKKLESIDDVLYTVTEGRIVRRRKNPLPALLIGVAGAGLAIWSLTASSMSEHENLASMLMLLGGGVALVGLIMAGIALASGSPVYEPTGEKIRRGSIYYDTARKQDLCAALEAGDADRLSRIPRGGSTSGVLLTLYATGSGSFAMAQVLEYVPHAFEPMTFSLPSRGVLRPLCSEDRGGGTSSFDPEKRRILRLLFLKLRRLRQEFSPAAAAVA